ncbi:serine protease snake-like [Scaptodrosophila lebanonensis]|uniref:Serine protease snake-like n=1 Tax=Drosophila lebanonensis TaxID=7225 RepID=A0A6J2TRR5_DROLE|nr:serine protease snake-like [Scaptodrosophila lebanonensis]
MAGSRKRFASLTFLLLVLLPFGTVCNPARRLQLQRSITYPKENYDDCFLDKEHSLPGKCKRMQDCPTALERWRKDKLEPKTCHFIKFDHYVCCQQELTTTESPKPTPNLPIVEATTPDFRDFHLIPNNKRPSLLACYMHYNAVPINSREITFATAVYGGSPTNYREFPYMAALGWRSNFDESIFYRCGGALLSNNFVLTAAHCIDFGGELPATVRLGGDNLTLNNGEDFKIKRVIIHPDYSHGSSYNDIALLELDTIHPPKLIPACVWSNPELATDQLTAIGYGQTRFAGVSSAQLLKVPLNFVSKAECEPHYQKDLLPKGVAETHLCAGDPANAHDTCQGDSGGPLLMDHGPFKYVVGITSLGHGCASGPPSIYTRVSSYVDWIESYVWPASAEIKETTPVDVDLKFALRTET